MVGHLFFELKWLDTLCAGGCEVVSTTVVCQEELWPGPALTHGEHGRPPRAQAGGGPGSRTILF
jgi:hypothetical protein